MAIDPVSKSERRFARKLVERLPKNIRVGAFDVAIDKWDASQSASSQRYGEFSSIEQRVSIQLDMSTRHKAVDTFLHEITHAIFWAYGIEDEDKEERITGVLSTGWTAFYRDNPWLLDWIKSAKL